MTRKSRIGGIMHNDRLALVGVMAIPSQPGTAGEILSAMGRSQINVQFIVQTVDLSGKDHVVFCVNQADCEAALQAVQEVKSKIAAEEIISEPQVGLISVFGPDFRQRPGIAGEIFATMGSLGINIKAISTSISTVSLIIDVDRVADAVQGLQSTFEIP
ncbi:MAG: ACT domain-containing protein [Anaerolineae bacterium]